MKISKNSLLVRMIFYNNIAIILVSVTIALFLTFIAFQDIETKVVDTARDKMTLINKGYISEMFKAKEDFNRVLNNAIKGDIFFENRPYWRQIEIIKRTLAARSMEDYGKSIVAIANSDGKILAENTTLPIFTDIDAKGFRETIVKNENNIKNNYLFKIKDRIYSRIVVKYPGKNLYYLLTLPLTTRSLKDFSELSGLNEHDKIFLYAGDKYVAGTFGDVNLNLSNIKNSYRRLVLRGQNYLYKKVKINGDAYYVILKELYDYKQNPIGTVGIGIYYEDIELMKIAISVSIIIIVMLFVAISTTISAKIFRKLLSPLASIVSAAEEVSHGNYDINLKPSGVDELRSLSNTFNKMAEEIRKSEKENKDRNLILKSSLRRINAIEKILMNIQISDSMTETIHAMLMALTSEMGLGYSRAMYFRYSREMDVMVGEVSAVNNTLRKKLIESDGTQGFEFQISELGKLIKLIKIPFKKNNLIASSLISKRVISYNEKGYRMELGNDLFNSLGIKNFLIMPIYSDSRNYGCILVDYFGTDKEVSKEEVELLTVLFLNIAVRLKNKNLERERIETERTTTVGKLIDRVFSGQEISLDKILASLDKICKTKGDEKILDIPIVEIKNLIEKLNLSQLRLNEYASYDKVSRDVELIDIDELLTSIVDEYKPIFDSERISISLFVNCDVRILGNKNRLHRAFYEIIKNAKESFNDLGNDNKKINITVTKEKNIDKVKIHIIDNGCGMNDEEIKNIFEPFVSYNETAPGLGLSLVSRIIKDHSGVIKYSSHIGEGTNVKITLNIYKEEIL